MVRRRLGPWPAQFHVLADHELKLALQRGFQSSDVDFAVALSGVAVADREQRAAHVDGDEERRSLDQLLVVEVARVNAGRPAADATGLWRWRHAHAAEE